MSRETRLYLDDIVACCDKIGRYTLGHTFETFRDSEIVVDAVTHEGVTRPGLQSADDR